MKTKSGKKRTPKLTDLSKVGVLICKTENKDIGSKIDSDDTRLKHQFHSTYYLTWDERGSYKITGGDHDIEVSPSDLPDHLIVGASFSSKILSRIQSHIERKRKPRKDTIYFVQGKDPQSGKMIRIFQKWMFDLDYGAAHSGVLITGRQPLLQLLEQLPSQLLLDNNTIKYVAERSEIKYRSTAIDFAPDTRQPGIWKLIQQRVLLMTSWYFRDPAARFIKNKWWKKPSEWSSENARLWRMLFAVLAVVVVLGMPILSFDYGVTWDEKIENDYGKDALNYLLTGGKDRRVFDESIHLYAPMRNYGMLFNVTAAAVNRFFSPFGEFETKHILNSWTGFLAMLFIGLIAKNIGGWRMAFLSMLFLLLSPRFFGHSMTNPKDIPFAAGYVMGVWAILKVFDELPKVRWRTIIWAALCIGFVMGIRIGGLMVLCYLGMMMGLHWLGQVRERGFGHGLNLVPRYAGYLGVVSVGSFLLAIMTWPYALEGPIKHSLEALSAITNVQYIVSYELFSGERTNMAALSWNYIPEWMLISMPVFIWLGAMLSPIAVFPKKLNYRYKAILFCLFVVLFPLIYVVYKGSVLYNGWRHFLFFAPFLVLLGALGWDALFKRNWNQILTMTAAGLLLLFVAKTTIWMAKNHPYQYVYFNELVGGIDGAYGRYETDYYGLSMREGIEWLVKNENIADGRKVRVGVNCEVETAKYWAKKYSENITVVWNRHYEKHKNQWDYAMFASRTMSRNELVNGSYPPVGTIHTIDVDNTPILAIIKHDNTYLHDGYKALRDNNPGEAIVLFQQAVNYDPRNEEAARMLGIAYYTSRRTQEAIQAFDRALDIWPESYLALFYKSQIMLQEGDFEQSYELATASINHKSNVQGAHLNAGRSSIQLGRFEEARDHLQNAYRYTGGDRNMQSDIHALFGQSYLIQVQTGGSDLSPTTRSDYLSNAASQLARAVELNPSNRDAITMIIATFEMIGDEENARKYRQMLASL